jgi:hypothetical protein
MALATTFVKHFPDIAALQKFIQTDAGIASIVGVFTDNSGGYILVYSE